MQMRLATLALVAAPAIGWSEPPPGIPSARPPIEALLSSRDLLLSRQYDKLTALVEREAPATEADRVDRLHWTLEAFRLDDPTIAVRIDEWVSTSSSWAPLLARALRRGDAAALARGARWASDTSDARFHRMGELLRDMRADCSRVLSLAPTVCRCHIELVEAAKLDGHERDTVVQQAFAACPLSYHLNVEHVFGLTPRWGGSYAAMYGAIAAARGRGLDETHARYLEAYVPADRASLLVIEGQADRAQAVLDAAINESVTPMLLQERAALHRRRGDARQALADANAALELSGGGWVFSRRRLTRLLVARAWALNSVGMTDDAGTDIGLLMHISPTDPQVLRLLAQIRPTTPRQVESP